MKLLYVAAAAVFITAPAFSQEAGECMTPKEADANMAATGERIVATRPLIQKGLPVGVRVLVQRTDGTFKEISLVYSTNQVCHVQDFIGDPRNPGASL